MTTMDLNNLGYRDEPFILAKDVNQVFYGKDMSTKPKKEKTNDNGSDNEPKRRIVLSGKRNIKGIEDRSEMSEDYEKNDGIALFAVNSDPSVLLNDEDTPWLWHDHNQGTYVKKKFIAILA
jgi:DNA-dependent RNA polymerase auxiliary subunit epsilon